MKVTGFEFRHIIGENVSDFGVSLLVDTEDGYLWWKERQSYPVHRKIGEAWQFSGTGKSLTEAEMGEFRKCFDFLFHAALKMRAAK